MRCITFLAGRQVCLPSAERGHPTCFVRVESTIGPLPSPTADIGRSEAPMARELPDNPNLDHLKKQARRLLEDRRLHDPTAQLSDALHALAREYGFVTWPALKAHVEAARARALDSPFAGSWTARLDESRLHPSASVT